MFNKNGGRIGCTVGIAVTTLGDSLTVSSSHHHHQTQYNANVLNAQIITLHLPQVPRRSPSAQRKRGKRHGRQRIRVLTLYNGRRSSVRFHCSIPPYLHTQGPSFYVPVPIVCLVILSPTLASGTRVFKNVHIHLCSNPVHEPNFSSARFSLTIYFHGLFRLSSLLTMSPSGSQLDEKLRLCASFFFSSLIS